MEEEELDPDSESDMEELKENLENVLGKSKLKKKLDEVKSQRSSVTGVSDIVKVWPLTTLSVVPFFTSRFSGMVLGRVGMFFFFFFLFWPGTFSFWSNFLNIQI